MRRIISSSRYIILIAVVCAFIAAVILLVYAGIATVQLAIRSATSAIDGKSVKILAVSFIEIIDVLLLGTVSYITAMGLYELFIDEHLPTPAWLHITQIDDLKAKLIGVVVVILVVVFLGQVVNWDGQRNLLFLGAAIAMVIGAATLFINWKGKDE
ncbi:MAG: YqhA family protein [Anaerolineales bacterium]